MWESHCFLDFHPILQLLVTSMFRGLWFPRLSWVLCQNCLDLLSLLSWYHYSSIHFQGSKITDTFQHYYLFSQAPGCSFLPRHFHMKTTKQTEKFQELDGEHMNTYHKFHHWHVTTLCPHIHSSGYPAINPSHFETCISNCRHHYTSPKYLIISIAVCSFLWFQ